MTSMQPPQPMLPGSPMPGSGRPGSSRLTPIDPLRVLKQYIWVLLGAAVVGVILGVVLDLVLLQVYPLYSAESTISVTPPVEDPLKTGTDPFRTDNERETFKNSQAYMIDSDENFRATLTDNDVTKTAWFNYYDSTEDRIEELQDSVTVIPLRDTDHILVRVTFTDKNDAATVCNALVTTYYGTVQRRNRDSITNAEEPVIQARNDAQTSVNALTTQMATLMAEGDLPAVQNRQTEVEMMLSQVLEDYYGTLQGLEMAKFSYNSMLEKSKQGDFDFGPEDEAMVNQDPIIKSRDDRIMQLKEQLKVMEARYGPNHRSVEDTKASILAVEDERDAERHRLLIKLQEAKIAEAENQVAGYQSYTDELGKKLEQLRVQQRDLNAKLAQYNELQERLNDKKDELRQLNDVTTRYGILRRSPRTIQVQVLNPARVPDEPSFPTMETMIPGVGVLTLLLVTGLVFLKELLDQRIKSPSCAKLLPAADLLGVIPLADEDPAGKGQFDLVVQLEAEGLMAESFRQLRAEIVNRMNRNGLKSLMLVGSQPGGGVSSIIANLAASIAMNNRKVLVIDANSRKPSLSAMFGLNAAPGLSELLRREAAIDNVIQPSQLAGLDFIAIGSQRGKVLTGFESPAFMETLQQLESRYDLVLIDAPPLAIVGDGLILANRVDAVVLIVRAMQEKRGMVSRILRQLQDSRAELLGIVINGVRSSSGGYYRRNYKAYYDYQRTQSETRSLTSDRQAISAAADSLARQERKETPND